jgi:hypothetical protein
MPGVSSYDDDPTPAASAGPDASAISKFYEGQLGGDTAALADLAKQGQASAPQFTEKPPERQQGITSVAPFLIGLAALGGKAVGLHATTMLGATNGMVQGLIQGNEQKYKDQRTAYDQAYQQYREKFDAQNKIFNEMRQVYKGRVDADLKALQFARQVTGDNSKVDEADAKHWLEVQKYDEGVRHHKMDEVDKAAKLHLAAVEEQRKRDKDAQAAKEAGGPENAQLLAAFAAASVPLPQGMRSKAVLQQTLKGLRERYPDKTNDEIVQSVKSGTIDMKVAMTEASKLATREAAIAPVEKSINQPGGFLDQAEKAINDVNFPPFKKKAEAEKWMMDNRMDPKLSAYKARIGELRAEYSQVLAKGGATSVHAQEESAKVVPEIITPAQFKEIEAAVKAGIQASKKGIRQSLDEVREPTVAPPPPAPTTPPDAPPGTTHWGDLPD